MNAISRMNTVVAQPMHFKSRTWVLLGNVNNMPMPYHNSLLAHFLNRHVSFHCCHSDVTCHCCPDAQCLDPTILMMQPWRPSSRCLVMVQEMLGVKDKMAIPLTKPEFAGTVFLVVGWTYFCLCVRKDFLSNHTSLTTNHCTNCTKTYHTGLCRYMCMAMCFVEGTCANTTNFLSFLHLSWAYI